jgi:hypothetical protein
MKLTKIWNQKPSLLPTMTARERKNTLIPINEKIVSKWFPELKIKNWCDFRRYAIPNS